MTDIAQRFSGAEIADFCHRALVAADMPDADARIVADLMAEADVNGSDGHGVFRLPGYIRRINEGGLNLTPNIRVEKEKSGMALVDGDNAQGHLVMRYCAELATKKAKDSGVAWVGSHASNHAGPAALYAKIPMAADMIGLYVAIGNANHLPPWGGTEMLLSTNPIAIAVPGKEEPAIVLDMATTVAAYGKVKTAAQRGEQMPEGWMIDRQGQPLTDPTKSDDGFLLPIGGPKGYGLALMFGLLAGTLNGAAFGKDVVDFNADFKTPTNTGQFIVAIDIAAFSDVETFKSNVDNIYRTMKASPTLPGYDEVLLPGEQSHQKRQDREANGVPIHDGLLEVLARTADDLGVEKLT
ncbi:MAG: Ldh family oxidoreductase [Rhodospirillaceae bacterium]|nr:Ldh family oxidoreductase [Rhodospirillaceae bacterium]